MRTPKGDQARKKNQVSELGGERKRESEAGIAHVAQIAMERS